MKIEEVSLGETQTTSFHIENDFSTNTCQMGSQEHSFKVFQSSSAPLSMQGFWWNVPQRFRSLLGAGLKTGPRDSANSSNKDVASSPLLNQVIFTETKILGQRGSQERCCLWCSFSFPGGGYLKSNPENFQLSPIWLFFDGFNQEGPARQPAGPPTPGAY